MSGIVVLILRVFLAVSLYGFIGWALYTLWRDLKLQSSIINRQSMPEISLLPRDDTTQPPRLFKQAEITIGRDPSCDFMIADDTVSAQHARLLFHHQQWWIEDRNSTNGTFLNKEQLTTPTVIVSGDELRCGQKSFEVKIHKEG